jgi:hypothetical protein
MSLDALVAAIGRTSSDPVALKLAVLLSTWKDDKMSTEELEVTVERFIGNAWINNEVEHKKIYGLWSQFKDEAIHGIGGMTMNERLYIFSLLRRWDSSQSEEERKEIRAKVLANP